MMKKGYFAIPVIAIALHYFLTNLLYYSVEILFLDILRIPAEQFMKYLYLGEILVSTVLFLVFFACYKLLWRREEHKLHTETNVRDASASMIAGFGVSGISFLWMALAEQIPALQKSVEAVQAGARNIAGGNAFGTFVIAVVAAPVIEELLFRGIVFKALRKVSPAWISILVSSVLFGAYHMNIVQATYATLMGIVAAIIYEKKKNLLFPILVHFANNLIAMTQSFASTEVDGMINIFVLIMILPLGYILYRLLQNKRAESV